MNQVCCLNPDHEHVQLKTIGIKGTGHTIYKCPLCNLVVELSIIHEPRTLREFE